MGTKPLDDCAHVVALAFRQGAAPRARKLGGHVEGHALSDRTGSSYVVDVQGQPVAPSHHQMTQTRQLRLIAVARRVAARVARGARYRWQSSASVLSSSRWDRVRCPMSEAPC